MSSLADGPDCSLTWVHDFASPCVVITGGPLTRPDHRQSPHKMTSRRSCWGTVADMTQAPAKAAIVGPHPRPLASWLWRFGPTLVLAGPLGLWLSARHGGWPMTLPFGIAAAVPLCWRLRAPSLVLAIVLAVEVAAALSGHLLAQVMTPALLIALFALDTRGTPRRSAAATAVASVVILLAGLTTAGPHTSWWQVVALLVIATSLWVAGSGLRLRRAYVAELEERAARLEAGHAEAIRRAAEDERARIARELHDVVSHHVGVIAIEAGAARLTYAGSDERTKELLVSIEETAHTALGELRRMLGVLRRGRPDAEELAPQPGLDRLAELSDEVRRAGLPLEVVVVGEPRVLPPGVDLSAYRIVQEALTNVMRHCGAVPTRARVQFGSDELVLVVTNEAPVETLTADDPEGHGLVGMRERVALLGGEFHAGPLPGGGYEVRARLHLDLAGRGQTGPVPSGPRGR
jgi:signal transduction histidine kinase